MKRQLKYSKHGLYLGLVFLICCICQGQDSTLTPLSLNLNYFAQENKTIYLMATAKARIDGRFKPIEGIQISIYLNEGTPDHLIQQVVTDENGLANAYLPIGLKNEWIKQGQQTFLATSEKNNLYESGEAELLITKTKLMLDTVEGNEERSILVKAYAAGAVTEGSVEWLPAKELEIKLGVERLGGILKVTEEETYMTDSAGVIIAPFIDTALPGDAMGTIQLAAKVEEHDDYGTLLVTKAVQWGKPTAIDTGFFDQRTLWSTRFRTPWWLLAIVYSMSLGIWGTLIFVIRSLVKTIKLGKT